MAGLIVSLSTKRRDRRVRLTVGGVTIWVELDEIGPDRVRLRFQAPPEVVILRERLLTEEERAEA